MQSKALTPDEYMTELPEARLQAMMKLRKIIKKNLPKGFAEIMQYGMISYVVPHKIYPDGYHCKPTDPLPFMCLASQKNFIAVYHMTVYSSPEMYKWFTDAYKELGIGKLDMGKSCIRFKKPEAIPFDLVGELAGKVTVKQWIDIYESKFKRK